MPDKSLSFQSKLHFLVLDGLRGLVALIVVLFHFMEIIHPDFTKNPLAHGFLGVDFFFCLSGFVIAYAYDQRAKHLSVWEFVKLRLIRLQPLVIIGATLGLIGFLFDPFQEIFKQYGIEKTLVYFFAGICLIPFPTMEERFFNLFSFNAPSWSLFWEYVANLFYILLLYKLPKQILSLIAFLLGMIIIYIIYKYHNLLGGWSAETFWHGGARIAYSFVIGMLIFRKNWIIKNNLSFYVLGLLLLLSFFVPYRENLNWITESFLVLIYFPLLVALGAGTQWKTNNPYGLKLSGDLSYPLYMTHYPFIWLFFGYYTTLKPNASTLWVQVPLFTFGLILVAYLVMKFLDFPIRNYFKRNILNK